jgi:hypothetical protein
VGALDFIMLSPVSFTCQAAQSLSSPPVPIQ